jgi:hypothetical protein
MKLSQIRNSNVEIRNNSKIRISNHQNKRVSNFVFGSFEFVSDFACLREAASAKAGISCFEFISPIHGMLNSHSLLCSWYDSPCTSSSSSSPMVSPEVFRSGRSFRGMFRKVSFRARHDGDGKRRHDPVVRIAVSKEFLLFFVEIA